MMWDQYQWMSIAREFISSYQARTLAEQAKANALQDIAKALWSK